MAIRAPDGANKREEDAPSAPHAMPLDNDGDQENNDNDDDYGKDYGEDGKMGMMGMMVIRRRMRTIFNIMIMAIDDGDFVTKERSRLFVRS